ncbi:NADH-quinone oxidoreductase subunit NuoH [Myxococcota bacterium]|nr:NADH-quinone oxidoreductase subunit NuoH [Myxococcota bacterium]
MKTYVDFVLQLFDTNAEASPYAAALAIFLGAAVVVLISALYAGTFIFIERRVSGRMMSRIGPNRNGPQGILQFVADAVKLVVKEDAIPDAADKPLFKLAPYLMAMGVFAGFAVLPLSPRLIGADLNIGVLYIMAITSISVVGVLMSGWASNSKWSLFGGMRAAAQIVSYEIPTAMSLLPGILLAGTLSTQGIIAAQGAAPWNWYIFHSPMTFVLFFVYFISSLAEGSRVPFDLPEADSELVSGYSTEYSGFRFAAYFLSEFANTWIAAALGTIVFLGGWQVPFLSMTTIANATGWTAAGYEALAVTSFALKTFVLVFITIQLRWTLPRVRVDQMMTLCWKYLLPIAFAAIFLLLGWMIVLPWESTAALIVRFVMFGAGVLGIALFWWRVRYNIIAAKDKFYFKIAV